MLLQPETRQETLCAVVKLSNIEALLLLLLSLGFISPYQPSEEPGIETSISILIGSRVLSFSKWLPISWHCSRCWRYSGKKTGLDESKTSKLSMDRNQDYTRACVRTHKHTSVTSHLFKMLYSTSLLCFLKFLTWSWFPWFSLIPVFIWQILRSDNGGRVCCALCELKM